ncbi:DUF1707 SHOCT-like domain-containing protein [Actinophytocola sp.]|uniref:DUF1707 SHOCT-like domain-containing protein n=1 Tax=Actinophytocola sp. TaxID=1872138 RepID=UPI003D6A2793
MSEYRPSDIRISDTEREDALGKLGEHMTAGRLDIDEYGERTAKVTAAKTRGELLDLFGDLPEPRPSFGRPAPPPAPASARMASLGHKAVPVLLPFVAVALAVVLMFIVKLPFIFLLPFIFIAVSSSRWRGHDQRRRDDRWRGTREHRDGFHDHRRRWRDEPY